MVDCDESYIFELETSVEQLTRRCASLEKVIIDLMKRKEGSFKEVERAIVDEWLSARGLKRLV